MSEGKTVLVVMAHPDDVEILVGGTLCRLKDHGWRMHMATMTHGDCGSAVLPPEEIAAIRTREAEASAALLGAEYHCLDQLDLMFFLDRPTLKLTVELLRRVNPDVVITHSPSDYMMDHEATSVLTRDATFGAPIKNVFTDAADPAPVMGHIPHLYYADPVEGVNLFGEPVTPGFRIDISQVIDRKEKLLACHASQREWLFQHHGIDEYLISMRDWSAKRGAEAGVAYAEGYRQHLGHAYPHDNLIGEVLGTV